VLRFVGIGLVIARSRTGPRRLRLWFACALG